ncbi:MAG: Dabb family protein [Lachnospiraceae bacterium]|uniref:Dabb family protein n=1 Tax=Candidatus Merdisoma sp. JLR.KK006 TaxID=3112626 RepID=UPI002FF064B7|nr:Dabb family protein [Lachnospiraceae bacterium]MCI9307275.1 Dabb family protein [Lachnospiraceae bacterium]
MVKHLVMWNFKEDFPEEKKEAMAKEADARLKALVGQIKGLTFAEMRLNQLHGSNRELLLVSELETPEDLDAYQVHPLHVAVAEEVIKPAACDRVCFDYEV